jgi:hypothetical protein
VRTTVLHRKQTRINTDAIVTATTVYVDSASNLPTAPWLGIINPTETSPEIVLVTANNTTVNPHSLTIVRAAMGTTALAIKADAVIYELGQKQVVAGRIADTGTAETVYIPMPKGFLVRLAGVSSGTLTSADSTITVSHNATSLGTITVAYNGIAAGDWDELKADGDAIADFYFDGVDDYLKVATDGGGTGTNVWWFIAEYIPY